MDSVHLVDRDLIKTVLFLYVSFIIRCVYPVSYYTIGVHELTSCNVSDLGRWKSTLTFTNFGSQGVLL